MKDFKENDNDYHFQKDKLNQLLVLNVQEKERSRIARELHDSSLQNLTHLIHVLELSSMYMDEDPIRAKLELESCTQSLKQIIHDIRDTIFNLRPMTFDDLGFKQCMKNEIDSLKLQCKDCEILYEVDDIVFPKDDNNEEICSLFLVTLYRVIQEALMNSIKHSSASTIMLSVKEKENELFAEIKDNGKGFCKEAALQNSDKHFGISIMNERISLLDGEMNVTTDSNGTIIKIRVPKPWTNYGGKYEY